MEKNVGGPWLFIWIFYTSIKSNLYLTLLKKKGSLKNVYKLIHLPPLSFLSDGMWEKLTKSKPQLRGKWDLTECLNTIMSSFFQAMLSFHAEIENTHCWNMSCWEPLRGMWCAQIKCMLNFINMKLLCPTDPV